MTLDRLLGGMTVQFGDFAASPDAHRWLIVLAIAVGIVFAWKLGWFRGRGRPPQPAEPVAAAGPIRPRTAVELGDILATMQRREDEEEDELFVRDRRRGREAESLRRFLERREASRAFVPRPASLAPPPDPCIPVIDAVPLPPH